MDKLYSIVECSGGEQGGLFLMKDEDVRVKSGHYIPVDRVERFNKRDGKILTAAGKHFVLLADSAVEEII